MLRDAQWSSFAKDVLANGHPTIMPPALTASLNLSNVLPSLAPLSLSFSSCRTLCVDTCFALSPSQSLRIVIPVFNFPNVNARHWQGFISLSISRDDALILDDSFGSDFAAAAAAGIDFPMFVRLIALPSCSNFYSPTLAPSLIASHSFGSGGNFIGTLPSSRDLICFIFSFLPSCMSCPLFVLGRTIYSSSKLLCAVINDVLDIAMFQRSFLAFLSPTAVLPLDCFDFALSVSRSFFAFILRFVVVHPLFPSQLGKSFWKYCL